MGWDVAIASHPIGSSWIMLYSRHFYRILYYLSNDIVSKVLILYYPIVRTSILLINYLRRLIRSLGSCLLVRLSFLG